MMEWPKDMHKLCLKTRIERQVVERNKIMITCTNNNEKQCFYYTFIAPELHTHTQTPNHDNFHEMSKANNSGQTSHHKNLR